jgi:signal transduction histidine kinase
VLLIWSTVLASVGGISLGLLVLFRAKKSAGNVFFSLMSIVLSLIVAANYFSLTNKDSPSLTLFWIRAVMFLVPFVMLFLYYFAHSYLNDEYKIKVKSSVLLGLVTVLVSKINITSLTYSGVTISVSGNIVPETGIGLILNAFYILPLFGIAVLTMRKNIKLDKNTHNKRMIGFALYSFLIAFGIQIITSFVIVAIFNYTALIPVGSFLIFLYVILMTISILYLKAFNINFVGAFAFAIILSMLMFAEIFTATNLQAIMYKIIVFLAVSLIGYEFIIGVRREIRQREEIQKLADDLKDANEHLKELDELKDDFLSMAAHELNTPLAAIEGYLSMILEEHIGGEINPKIKKYLENMFTSSKRLSLLVKDMLNVSRIESGRIHLIYTDTPIESVIEQAIAEIGSNAKERNQSLIFHKPKTKMSKTWFDASRITEVLINIIGNAIKYTDSGGKIEVFVKSDDKFITISIKDNGRGIPKDKIDTVFEKFSQVDILKDEVKGTGLGMYIAKKFVELLGGRIWFDSTEGKGSTFYFTLPFLKDKPRDPHEGEGEVLH